MKQFILFVQLVKPLKFVINYPYNKHRILIQCLVHQIQIIVNKKIVCLFKKKLFLFFNHFDIYLGILETNRNSIEKPERYLQSVQVPIVINKNFFYKKKTNLFFFILVFNK
jgi:hypothetical protein